MAVVIHHPVWGAIVREVPEKDVAAWTAAGWVLPEKSEVSPRRGVSVRDRRAENTGKEKED